MTTAATTLGLLEIAEFLEVAPRTVHQWRQRGVLPDPDGPLVHGKETWKRATVLQWGGETGRLRSEDLQEAYRRRFKRKPVAPRSGGRVPVRA